MANERPVKTCQVCDYATRDWHRIGISNNGVVKIEATLCPDHTDRFLDYLKMWLSPLPA